MKHIITKAGAVLLSVVLFLCVLPAAVAALSYNTGERHELCTELSQQAEAYYTGTYAPEALYAMEGSATAPMQSEMYTALNALMTTTHTTQISYNGGSNGLQVYFPYTDAQTNGSGGTNGTLYFYSESVNPTNTGLTREHVWPKSHASFYQRFGGADLHHLRPDYQGPNSSRGNATMGDVKLKGSNYRLYPAGSTESTAVLWHGYGYVEVRDNIKGDVARIFLYVWCRWKQPNMYEDVAQHLLPPFDPDDSANDGIRVMESLDTLLRWMEIDPVDDWEMGRNDIAQQVQGNRNVFIDYPELAWLIFEREVPEDYPTPSGYTPDPKPSFLWGDANCDHELTAADAAALLRHLAELTLLTPQGMINANVTGSAKLSAADAALILRYLAGLYVIP
ncbi:MAG: endonuclease [Clostridiales bacterium]|nr:endonuclease [Clostridiales bacterium]